MNIWKVKIWLSQEKSFCSEIKKHFPLFHKCSPLDLQNRLAKKVVQTTFHNFLKYFEHVYICLTITIWNAWIKLLLLIFFTHIQQINFIPQLIESLLIHQFEVLLAYPGRADHNHLRCSFYGYLLELGLGICQNTKNQLQLNSIFMYCWFSFWGILDIAEYACHAHWKYLNQSDAYT